MNKFTYALAATGLLLGLLSTNQAQAFDRSSCLEPIYLVGHLDDCMDEFAECFEGYDNVWDAASHADDIALCIADFIEQETEDAVDDVVEAVTDEEDSDTEAAIDRVMDAIFGINNELHDRAENAVEKFTSANQKLRDKIRELIQNIRENRQDAREKLKEFIKTAIENRKNARQQIKEKIKSKFQQ